MGNELRGHPDPCVPYANDNVASFSRDGDPDVSARARVLDGIIQQIPQDLRQAHRVSFQSEGFRRKRQRHFVSLFIDSGPKRVEDTVDNARDVDAPFDQRELATANSRRVQEASTKRFNCIP
jgi:hypothetical protein